LAETPFTNFLLQLLLVFIGAGIGYFIPRFFGWKGEYRNEKIEYITKILENCYGVLKYNIDNINERLQKLKQDGLTEGSILVEKPEELKQIYSVYHHEFEKEELENLKFLINHLIYDEMDDTGYLYDPITWIYIEKLHNLVNAKHSELSNRLKYYRELKEGVKNTIIFHLKFHKM